MDIYTLISNLTSSLAWPVAVIFIIYLLKNPICQLIPLIRKLKYKEFELEFSEALKEISSTADENHNQAPEQENEEVKKYLQLIEISPRSAIVEAWCKLETELLDCGLRHNMSKENLQPYNITAIAQLLTTRNIISQNQLDTFIKLKVLRNRAVHNDELFEVSEQNAKEYVGRALLLASRFSEQ